MKRQAELGFKRLAIMHSAFFRMASSEPIHIVAFNISCDAIVREITGSFRLNGSSIVRSLIENGVFGLAIVEAQQDTLDLVHGRAPGGHL